MSESYLLTGALGCIGSWVTKRIVERGDTPIVFDLGDDPRRIRDVLDDEHFSRVKFVQGDITDYESLRGTIESTGAKKIIHLAGLQVPFCKADPAKGARVNVLGTINVFEAAKACGVERVSYASSAAVYGPGAEGAAAPDESAACEPLTHYGVYKRANEGGARIYWLDDGVSSVGIRPLTVYGVGRDQGMTSDPTRAMKAAVVGQPFEIRFGGATDFQYVADTADTFIAAVDRAPQGAHVFNLHGDSVELSVMLELIRKYAPAESREGITLSGPPIPIPPALDGSAIAGVLGELPVTPLDDGVRATMEHFQLLKDEGRLDTRELSA
jgi:nucleoside-diphosphate-sugar epimerase